MLFRSMLHGHIGPVFFYFFSTLPLCCASIMNCYNITLKKDDNYSRFLVSFAGRYLPYDYCVASTHDQSKEDSPSRDHR